MKTKNWFIIGLFLFIIIGCEVELMFWIQNVINNSIPKDEYYNIIKWTTIVAHIVVLGPLYIGCIIWSLVLMMLKIK